MRHIDTVTVGALVSITSIEQARFDSMVLIDRTTRDNLELVRNLRDGSRTNTLLDVIDRTVSVGGARLLRQWIQAPSSDAIEILRRQEIVSSFERCTELRSQIRRSLASAAELDRVGARLELAIASPRELGAMRDTLVALTEIQSHLNSFAEASCAAMAESLSQSADARATVGTILSRSLVELPPLSSREGGIFREGFDEELDRLRALSQDGASWMTGLEIRERDRTGISSLKIKFNNVIGYFIEITKAHKEKVPPEYTLRQDTANALRYVTEELKSREHEVVGARDASLRREEKLLQELRSSLKEFAPLLRDLSQFLANLDVLSALAELAVSEGYTRPRIVEGSTLEIVEGRHPVVAALLRGQFVPNSLRLGEGDNRCVLLTGPNMGGKSTYLRQAALIVILAQLGSWVPARAVTLGVVDRIFARIGASDDMAEGESTFMVEMKEASHIVSTATQSSLVLIDEIGRGTSTTDGLAIAQAILEWIVEKIRCRTLFATHYHELTDYPDRNAAVVNMSVGSHDHDGEVVFTHEIRPGPANRSYGLEVARVAGLPSPLIARARECLQEHEHAKAGTVQLNLFAPRAIDGAKEREVESLRSFQNSIGEIDPQRMTPLEALVALDALVTQARKGGKR